MKRYDKPIKISSVKLTKKDIIDLMELVEKEKRYTKSFDEPSASIHEDEYTIDDLNSKNFSTYDLPDKIFDLYIYFWMGKNTKESITVSLNKNANKIGVVGSDKVWVEGKKEELRQFLEKRKPCYSFIHQYPTIYGFFEGLLSVLIGAILGIIFIVKIHSIFIISLLIVILSLYYLSKRIGKGTLLPNFIGVINSRVKWYNDKMYVVALITLIVAFISLIIGFIRK